MNQPSSPKRPALLFALTVVLAVVGAFERVVSYLSGSLFSDSVTALSNLEAAVDTLPLLGHPGVQTACGIAAVMSLALAIFFLFADSRRATPQTDGKEKPRPEPPTVSEEPCPKLEIRYDISNNYGRTESGDAFARVCVFNVGSRPATRLKVVIESLARRPVGAADAAQFTGMPLQQIRGEGEPLNPGDFAEFHVVSSRKDSEHFVFQTSRADEHRGPDDDGTRYATARAYLLTIRATCSEGASTTRSFRLGARNGIMRFNSSDTKE